MFEETLPHTTSPLGSVSHSENINSLKHVFMDTKNTLYAINAVWKKLENVIIKLYSKQQQIKSQRMQCHVCQKMSFFKENSECVNCM